MQLKELVVVLVLVCGFVNEATALKCYTCVSSKDWSSCNDNKKETECPAGITHCSKAKVEAKGGGADVLEYAKGCSNNCKTSDIEQCNKKTQGVTISCEVNCCTGDLCNTGSAPLVSVVMILACALLSAFF